MPAPFPDRPDTETPIRNDVGRSQGYVAILKTGLWLSRFDEAVLSAVYKASRLAHEKNEAADMRHEARQKLETTS